MSVFETVVAAAREHAARRSLRRRRSPMVYRVAEAKLVRSAAIRMAVALVWATIVGALTYGGARAFDLPDDDLVSMSILSAAGAAIYVVFFAGGS